MMDYTLNDHHITGHNVSPPGRYYLREVVDPYCSEYRASILTDDQRRAMFEAIGREALTDALVQLYATDKHFDDDDAAQTVRLAEWRLYTHAPL